MSEEPSPAVSKNVSFSSSPSLSKGVSSSLRKRLNAHSMWSKLARSKQLARSTTSAAYLRKIPVVVRVRANVLRVVNVDLQGQCFTALYKLEASWVAPELKLAAERLGKKVSELIIDEQQSNQRVGKLFLADAPEEGAFFAPRLYLNNLVNLKPEESESEEWFTVYEGAEGGDPIVCFRWKLMGTFQEIMELKLFPFDVQNLTIEIKTGWEAENTKCGVLLVENQNARCVSLAPRTLTFVTSRLPLSPLCWSTPPCWPTQVHEQRGSSGQVLRPVVGVQPLEAASDQDYFHAALRVVEFV